MVLPHVEDDGVGVLDEAQRRDRGLGADLRAVELAHVDVADVAGQQRDLVKSVVGPPRRPQVRGDRLRVVAVVFGGVRSRPDVAHAEVTVMGVEVFGQGVGERVGVARSVIVPARRGRAQLFGERLGLGGVEVVRLDQIRDAVDHPRPRRRVDRRRVLRRCGRCARQRGGGGEHDLVHERPPVNPRIFSMISIPFQMLVRKCSTPRTGSHWNR